MRSRIITAALLSAALAAGPAAAARTAAAQPGQEQGPATSQAMPEKKICKRLQNTGTRLRNDRVCHTRAEWRKVEDDR